MWKTKTWWHHAIEGSIENIRKNENEPNQKAKNSAQQNEFTQDDPKTQTLILLQFQEPT